MKKILIIDDDRVYRLVNNKILTDSGYQVLTAENGKLGFEMAVKEKPDLIILDMIMPEQHGFSTIDQLEKNQATKDIPVIVWTNFTAAEDMVKEKNIASFILKSETNNEDIIQKVKEILGS